MPVLLDQDGWVLHRARDADLEMLMGWFSNAADVTVWGGPRFRYPFTRESFVEDSHWNDMDSFFLRDAQDRLQAFGQFYNRNEKINLARLIAHPGRRGQGIGKRLVSMLMAVAPQHFSLQEFSLFVYRDNAPALGCYQSLGFEIRDYPPDQLLAEECYYLTRPVTGTV